MKGIGLLLALVLSFVMVGCQRDIPEPKTKALVVSAAQTTNNEGNNFKHAFFVKHYIRGSDVQIECIIPDFTFQNNSRNGSQSGKLQVYIDGKLYKQVTTAAFTIKNLQSGNHRILLQIVDQDGKKTSMKKEIIVTIP
jgi:imidazole glycerol phosphate synthase subunit HisF